jgi:hypothetical protein
VPSDISLEGEVVQISERDGMSSLRLVVRELTVLEIASSLAKDVHLGDRIALDGSMWVDAVRPLPANDYK